MLTKIRTPKMFILAILVISAMVMAACDTQATPSVNVLRSQAAETPEVAEDSSEAEQAVEPVTEPEDMVTDEISDLTVVDEDGITAIDTQALDTALSVLPETGELSAVEAEGLLWMREEEKLARDVYLALYDLWNMNIFQNIAASEQTHTDAVKSLLDQYGLDDPMATDARGVFENPELQSLYDQLVAQGAQSLGDALQVGAAVEEIDILDLEEYIAQTDKQDIQIVYESLMKGSRNHLRSFVNTLQRQAGITYQPQYLSQGAYQEIIGSDIESGGNRNGRGNGRGNGGRGNGDGGNGGGNGFGG